MTQHLDGTHKTLSHLIVVWKYCSQKHFNATNAQS